MKLRHASPIVLVVAAACAPAAEQPAEPTTPAPAADQAPGPGQTYAAGVSPPEIVFENDYVVLQQFVTQPGVWTGEHGHQGNQFGVVFEPTTTTYIEGTEETVQEFVAGEFLWVEAVQAHNHQTSTRSMFTIATIKQSPSTIAGRDPAAVTAPGYPNHAGELILDNDSVIVRRHDIEPGVWAGPHSHAGDELSIMLTGASATFRVGEEETERTFSAGEIVWTEAGEEHDHGNTGAETISYYVVKLR